MSARWPNDIAFIVQSKRAGAQKWTTEDTFIVDVANGIDEGIARAQADELHVQLYTNHTGGETDYIVVRCGTIAWETRPVV